MSDVSVVYDGLQHCRATKLSQNKTVDMDCPHTGKGEEFSPTNLVEAALAGCMLLAMGAPARRHGIDLTGMQVAAAITSTDMPMLRFESVAVRFKMPAGLSARQRVMLENAAEVCPVKHSFASEVRIQVDFDYPD